MTLPGSVPTESRLAKTKQVMDILQAIATIAALAVGGVWTYRLVIVQRQEEPRLKIEHKISQHKLPSGETLLSIDEMLSNPGTTLVALRSSEIRIIPLLPLPPGVAKEASGQDDLPNIVRSPDKWPVLKVAQRQFPDGERLLEPGEEDQMHSEFTLPAKIQVICVASYVENPKNPKVGWQRITIYDIVQSAIKKKSNTTGK